MAHSPEAFSLELLQQQLGISDTVATHGLGRALRHLQTELAIYQGHQESVDTGAVENLALKPNLQIGSGVHTNEDFTNVDIIPHEGVDLVWDVREGLPFEDDTFGMLFSEHVLEHLDYPRSAKLLLSEGHRVLQPGGSIVVGVPDASLPVRAYAESDTEYFDDLRQRWYGKRDSLSHYDQPIDLVRLVFADEDDNPKYTSHLWGYDETKLAAVLEEAGFVDIKPWEFDPTIANPKREWGSVYLEARKSVEQPA